MSTKTQVNSKAPAPFTYEHFIKAVHGLKNDMLKCYIKQATGIYCNLRHIIANPEENSLAYADALDASNYAIYIVSTKIQSYNPEMGEFKSYLNRSLSNVLKDILKEDNKGDFFDQTAHKRGKDDVPEKHSRVDIDCYWGAGEEADGPDNAGAEKENRIRRHQNEALDVMIKYIDSLPELKRSAIYASAFGQVLRPDLENYGRDYAETIAEIYNTTALYVRKLAAEGKRAALAEARRCGYDEQSMMNVSMEFIQTRPTTSGGLDKVFQSITQLNPYEQFIFLQHLANKIDGNEQSK